MLTMEEPKISKRGRSIAARYDTGTMTPSSEYDTSKKILFTLLVSYSKAGINYFNGERTTTDYYAVNVLNETERDNGVIGFTVGSGVGLARIEQKSNRFSRKQLQKIFDEWRENIEGWLSAPEYCNDTEVAMLNAIMPYVKGEKAGLA